MKSKKERELDKKEWNRFKVILTDHISTKLRKFFGCSKNTGFIEITITQEEYGGYSKRGHFTIDWLAKQITKDLG